MIGGQWARVGAEGGLFGCICVSRAFDSSIFIVDLSQ
jgi:hypothetical protein